MSQTDQLIASTSVSDFLFSNDPGHQTIKTSGDFFIHFNLIFFFFFGGVGQKLDGGREKEKERRVGWGWGSHWLSFFQKSLTIIYLLPQLC